MGKITKSKFTYAKCPYCKHEYREDLFDRRCIGRYTLSNLALNGDLTEENVRCLECNKYFRIKIHISYYGSKIKEVEDDK